MGVQLSLVTAKRKNAHTNTRTSFYVSWILLNLTAPALFLLSCSPGNPANSFGGNLSKAPDNI